MLKDIGVATMWCCSVKEAGWQKLLQWQFKSFIHQKHALHSCIRSISFVFLCDHHNNILFRFGHLFNILFWFFILHSIIQCYIMFLFMACLYYTHFSIRSCHYYLISYLEVFTVDWWIEWQILLDFIFSTCSSYALRTLIHTIIAYANEHIWPKILNGEWDWLKGYISELEALVTKVRRVPWTLWSWNDSL